MSTSLDWNSPLIELFNSKKPSKTFHSLDQYGVKTLYDLLWLIPLRVELIPPIQSFDFIQDDQWFQGMGKIISVRNQPNFKGRGKGKAPLSNLTVLVQDNNSSATLTLKWFNCYPSMVQKVQKTESISFIGKVSSFMGNFQIVNPDIHDIDEQTPLTLGNGGGELKVQYPTTNKVTSHHLKNVINKIPENLWNQIEEHLSPELIESRELLGIQETFKIIHAKHPPKDYSKDNYEKAKNRLIYEEFFNEQIKLLARKNLVEEKKGLPIKVEEETRHKIYSVFPYQLTEDQKKTLNDIEEDFKSGHQMMRMVQGDVGSGKTSVALGSAIMAMENFYQVALMCPTESLALQHFINFKDYLKGHPELKVDLLLGSTKKKEKDRILEELKNGEINLLIGTHSLIQDTVSFENLGLAIIDEQHKFGVNQRLKLVNKNKGTHCLIMTATPIPRSLSLTQYGDLEISTIKTMPSNRKGTQTRIVTPGTFQKFLTFLNTRLSMSEQAYLVVPAITESEDQDILNLENVLEKFKALFPQYRVEGLHGQMKAEIKNDFFMKFKNHEIDLLVSTSVVEVGINVLNATVMSILNPERFGLSSLHQLRGRVGRGEKPGFCFLVCDKPVSATSMERLQVIEKTSDGFEIAEEDLKIRGEGDVFGSDQSGATTTRVLASVLLHQPQLLAAREDVQSLYEQKYPPLLQSIEVFQKSEIISLTV